MVLWQGGERQGEQTMRHTPRGGETRLAEVHFEIKPESTRDDGTVISAKTVLSSKFVILIIEHFMLHLDQIWISMKIHVDWLMVAMAFGEHSYPVWCYEVFVQGWIVQHLLASGSGLLISGPLKLAMLGSLRPYESVTSVGLMNLLLSFWRWLKFTALQRLEKLKLLEMKDLCLCNNIMYRTNN